MVPFHSFQTPSVSFFFLSFFVFKVKQWTKHLCGPNCSLGKLLLLPVQSSLVLLLFPLLNPHVSVHTVVILSSHCEGRTRSWSSTPETTSLTAHTGKAWLQSSLLVCHSFWCVLGQLKSVLSGNKNLKIFNSKLRGFAMWWNVDLISSAA